MKFQSGAHKVIVATVDENGSEIYYYGYATIEHVGGHVEPFFSKVEWVEGTVKRSAKYPEFSQGEITSGQNRIEPAGNSQLRSRGQHRLG